LKKGFRVVGVEANPDHCRGVDDRLGSYVRSGHLRVVNTAIGPSAGEIAFYLNDFQPEWATIHRQRAEYYMQFGGSVRTIKVPATRFEDLLSTYGVPYYVKIDIEGADNLCVEGLASCAARPKFVSLETSKTSFGEVFDVLSQLSALGYRRFKVVPQQWMRFWRCPNPAREGTFVDHQFPAASSGPFGRELPGRWLDLEATVRRYLRVFRLYRTFGDESALHRLAPWSQRARVKLCGWHDLHAMHVGERAGPGEPAAPA
ncbi:MAG: FkbM family methyltransferase, partial [Candidatus Dormibacteraeota bacterium]|nr:FkbM family methyltransferase [Candidatus Dormibacteraeota bacterium]